MNTFSYPYLPDDFPRWVECATHMLGTCRQQARSLLTTYFPTNVLPSGDFPDKYLIEIVPQVDVMLNFAYDTKGLCDQVCIFLRGPVPQLGDCVHYFCAHGVYRTQPTPRGWLLPGGVRVVLSKEEDEVCCQFLPFELPGEIATGTDKE
ncbi:MAG: hypothetical protein LIP08_03790 [Bacteroides sp.]|nr:hypothetical protein [Bacteroides sp.]